MNNNRLISDDKIIKRLQIENPWWTSNQIPEEIRKMSKKLYFDLFYPHVIEFDVNRALVLMGPRRVGKTVMLYHSIDKLISNGINPQKIFFVSIDHPIYFNLSLQDIIDLCLISLKEETIEDCYIFFDEIQYLADWERHLKALVDSNSSTKFIVSGSAAAALKLQSSESGAGRFTHFLLPPLTFQEYLFLKNKSHFIKSDTITYGDEAREYYTTINIDELNFEFLHYINYGGYPEVVLSEKIQNDMNRYVKSDIVDKVLLRDLPSLYGIRDVQELNRFFTYLAYNTGKEFSYENMTKESGIQKDTLKKYLEYLEATFLIKVLNKVDMNAKYFRRITSFKVYLTNPSLRTALFSPIEFNDEEIGNIVETAILSQWMHRKNLELTYARWKDGEVDLVLIDNKSFKPIWGIEIKWSNRYFNKPKDLSSLIKFCKANNFSKAISTTISELGIKELEELKITFIPASIYAYNLGDNTLKLKNAGI